MLLTTNDESSSVTMYSLQIMKPFVLMWNIFGWSYCCISKYTPTTNVFGLKIYCGIITLIFTSLAFYNFLFEHNHIVASGQVLTVLVFDFHLFTFSTYISVMCVWSIFHSKCLKKILINMNIFESEFKVSLEEEFRSYKSSKYFILLGTVLVFASVWCHSWANYNRWFQVIDYVSIHY